MVINNSEGRRHWWRWGGVMMIKEQASFLARRVIDDCGKLRQGKRNLSHQVPVKVNKKRDRNTIAK